MDKQHDIAAGRLDHATLAANFADAHKPLTPAQAVIEANRCYFCHDAPCIEACPTGIDIPSFIRKITTGNLRGSAQTILDSNILGGSCARVCPTEILCERACVHTAQDHKPIEIGALQRHATDWLMQSRIQPFTRAPDTGRRVAVVGAGPAGLACAHRLARAGVNVTIYEARPKPGGLNEYGIAAYKLVDDFAQAELAFVVSIGGITIVPNAPLGVPNAPPGVAITLDRLRHDYDAVFLGMGLHGSNALGLADDGLHGVMDAVDFIARLRQSDKSDQPVGRRVVVIGGGNTAIDAATQSRLLGADDVTIVYRRGPEQMSATPDEQDWAKRHGVRIRHFLTPVRLLHEAGGVTGIELTRTRQVEDRLVTTTETVTLAADMVLKAIGQTFVKGPLGGQLTVQGGRIVVDAGGRTSLPRTYAGGDCIAGPDLTVQAVQDGKIAAESIIHDLALEV